MKRLALAIPVLLACISLNAQSPSDGKEWAASGGKFNAEKTLADLPAGYRFEHVMVAMRDGVALATTMFLPPGDGPWATILIRTPYERNGGAKYFKSLCAKGSYACVIQDPRGDGDSQGKPLADPVNSENEIADSYDTIDWIAKQPWSNGRVGMTGGSGNGMAAAMAYLCKHPALVVVEPANSAGNTALYWGFENGVRRKLYEWLNQRNLKVSEWPRPTIYHYDRAHWNSLLDEAAKDNKTVYLGSDGWFNIFGDSAVDFFEKFGPSGKVFIAVNASAHGAHCDKGVKFKIGPAAGAAPMPSFLDVLDGKVKPEKSQILYAVLGDVTDPSAPGNVKRASPVWPPTHVPTPFYLTPSGGLSLKPAATTGKISFPYDPANPVPSLGGGWSFGNDPNGAVDQRPLADRKDVVRLVSEPLDSPLEIAGKIRADLFISSDAPDTLFVVKLVDIYPDGQEILLREAAAMARYRDGFDKPAPLEPGKTVRLAFDCNSIAAVFNKGHRIGVFITSSSSPAYEVHPNTYEPAASADQMKAAIQNIHISPTAPSSIILPVVK
jgi:predicted acyl esterase